MSPTAMLIYGLVALGALGIYFVLPKSGRSTRMAGRLICVAALAGVIVMGVTGQFTGGRGVSNVYFYLFSSIVLIAATCVITQTKAVYSALYFILVILGMAGLVLLLEAEFLATALIIVYGGAILVTYVFVIMLAQQSHGALYDRWARQPLMACFAGFLMTASVATVMTDFANQQSQTSPSTAQRAPQQAGVGNTEQVGAMLLTDYVVVLELAGVLLLLAMIGAITIARKKLPSDPSFGAEGKLVIGEAGKKAAPF